MPYSADSVDELLAKFQKCAQRQTANKGSAVKLRAAESDLLTVAEKTRDLLNKAVQGDRDLLVQVFGGSCRRFHYFRQAMETVELSPMHAKDHRWQDLTASMDTVEEILKQLGTFKPFAEKKKIAPEISGYKGLCDRLTPGDKVWMRPECEGEEAESFSVSPELPEGLQLDRASGEISGFLKPGREVPAGTYTMTAKNAYGETKIELSFSVAQLPPTGVAYTDVPSACYTGEVVNWAPEVQSGSPSKWSVSPPLPAGLALDAKTGAISGMPTAAVDPAEYTITAANTSGSVSAVLSFGVKPAPPMSLHYADAVQEYPLGTVIYMRPDVGLKTSASRSRALSANWQRLQEKVLTPNMQWKVLLAKALLPPANMTFTVKPALPEGLTLATKTGVISGKPSAPAEEETYRVTAHNDGGEISTDITFGVKLQAPSSLQYPAAGQVLLLGQPATLSPEVQGLASEWTVEPALPPGLNLDPSMGIISGIPTEVMPQASWTVTAKSDAGEAAATLTFAVQRAAPSGFAYPELQEEYPVLRAMAVQCTVEGKVDSFTVDPPLPAGLEIDAATGAIRGTPSAMAEPATYTVTARNERGASTASLTFGMKVMPPTSLSFPQVDDVYHMGEEVSLEPQVEGGATSWAVESALPAGIQLDPATGKISGAPMQLAEEASYVVTASNEAGGTSAVLTFAITAPEPSGLRYPDASGEYTVDSQVSLEPQLSWGVCSNFSVEPALPEGLNLHPSTGAIKGTPAAESEPTTYTVSATNSSGSCSTELTFSVTKASETNESMVINQNFASAIEEITDIADLGEEPEKASNLGDWMIWMVHRAWLNDPSLTDFNFSNKWMPPPHMEPRIAPKLMKALAHNTSIISLHLANANVMKPQGHQLAASIKRNTTLQILNVETNSLDSDSLSAIAEALKENKESGLEQLILSNQRGLGDFFGRSVEQAFAEALKTTNITILKLGLTCSDAHWRLVIDQAIQRNNDLARWRRKATSVVVAEEIAAQDKTLSRLVITHPPEKPVYEVFDLEDDRVTAARSFMAEKRRLPTGDQLQSFASDRGMPIPYSAAASVQKDFRRSLLSTAVNSNVAVYDSSGAHYPHGSFHAWSEKNERWKLDVWQGSQVRHSFNSNRQPILEVSSEFAAWLNPPY